MLCTLRVWCVQGDETGILRRRCMITVLMSASLITAPNTNTSALLAAVSYVDHNIGQVLDALASTAAAKNTVVAIMGDPTLDQY